MTDRRHSPNKKRRGAVAAGNRSQKDRDRGRPGPNRAKGAGRRRTDRNAVVTERVALDRAPSSPAERRTPQPAPRPPAGPVEVPPSSEATGPFIGTVIILGRPNVGKSTLLNRMVGEKLAIVSPKPQTTRNRIVGVWNGAAGQIVFVDTPGVHAARGALNRFMVEQALGAVEDVDAALLVVEPSGARSLTVKLDAAESRIVKTLEAAKKPVVLAINKVDTVIPRSDLLPMLKAWNEAYPFAGLVPVSAKRGTGVPDVIRELCKLLPEGPPIYSPDMLTDRTERFLVSELIREQLFLSLRQELPYSTAVEIDNWDERTDRGDVVIDASIVVERDSQKTIVVGKGGAMVRDIGTRARAEATQLLGRPAHLRLHVKVAPGWTTSPEALARLGYHRSQS
jgi:GTP-binding protein Era